MPEVGDYVAYFYLPLEQTLEGVVGPFLMELSPDNWPSRLADALDSRLPATPLDVSIALTTSTPIVVQRLDQLNSAMHVGLNAWQALNGRNTRRMRFKLSRLQRALRRNRSEASSTVVEAAVTLPKGWQMVTEGPDEVLAAAMDSALVAVRLLLLQVCSAQPDVPRVLPSAESLPAAIPYTVCEVTGDERQPLRPVLPDNFSMISNDLGTEAMVVLYEPPEPPPLLPMRNSFATYWSLRNDAAVSLRVRGQYRSSLLLVAAAAENLLDSIGQLLLWSDGVTVDDAALLFSDRAGPLKRANTILSPRVGGGWRADASSPIGDWVQKIVLPRNEAIHLGVEVSRETAWDAWHALNNLRLHVGGLLMRKQSTYPIAALSVSLGLNLSSSPTKLPPTATKLIDRSPPGPGQKIVDFEKWQRALVSAARAL